MNAAFTREHLAEMMIIFAVVFGAWFFFIDSRSRELSGLEARIAQVGGDGSGSAVPAPDALAQLSREVASTKSTLEEIARRNEFARDASTLYESISGWARRCDVEVHRVNPGAEPRRGADQRVTTTKLTISVGGSFDRVIRFIDGLQELDGFIRPTSVTISPTPMREGGCTAEIECELLQFTIPAVLQNSLEGSTHAGT